MNLNKESIRIMTFNIRYENEIDDLQNNWNTRRKMVTDLISFHHSDIIGLQEVLKNQLDYLKVRLPEYMHYGIGREDGKEQGEFSPIFFVKDKFELLDKGYFWLSETPDQVSSIGWDAALTRIVTWVKLRCYETDSVLYIFNGHFDHFGKTAAIESSKLVLQKIAEIAGSIPAFFMGDLNNTPASKMYHVLTNGGLYDCIGQTHYGPNESFIGFHPIKTYYHQIYASAESVCKEEQIGRIDYIFCSQKIPVIQYGILSDHLNGLFPSDHMPAVTDILLPAQQPHGLNKP